MLLIQHIPGRKTTQIPPPNRQAYINERDSFYEATREYYRNRKEYFRERNEYYRNKSAAEHKASTYGNRETHPADATGKYPVRPKFTVKTLIDPNTADSALLCSIPGIGKAISSNIIKYRDRLGGFTDVNQLLECRYFTPELLEWFAMAESPEIRKIHINTASFAQLVSHPYISKEQTKEILNYIRLNGAMDSKETLRRTNIFSEEELSRIAPYLEF